MTGTIFNIKRFAVHDGPGIRTTVFMKGCPLRCFWCHNQEGWSTDMQSYSRKTVLDGSEYCEQEMIGREVSLIELMHQVERERIFMEESGGGVTFSGGEPLMQPEFLEAALKYCRETGFHVAVDTSGYAELDILERIAPLTDLFLYDLKIMDDDLHQKLTGVSNRRILENLEWLVTHGHQVQIRIPLIRGLTAVESNLQQVIRFLKGLKNQVSGIDLLPYHRLGKSKYLRMNLPERDGLILQTPDPGELKEIESSFLREGFQVSLA